MLRLTLVFAVWIASTAYALEDPKVVQDAELHEAYEVAWDSADDDHRRLLDQAQRAWYVYRAANCALLGEECYVLMAQERAAELRSLGWTNTNVRTIVPARGRTGDKR